MGYLTPGSPFAPGNYAPHDLENYTSQNSRLDQPRAVIVLAGEEFLPISIEITQSSHGTLSTAQAVLSISANPDLSLFLQTDQNEGSVVAQIYLGFPANPSADLKDYSQLERRFWGIVDTLEPDFGENTVTITMRSLGALLELTKQTNLSLNETTVSFVQAAAKSVGLRTNIVLKKNQVPGTLGEVFGSDLMVGFHNQRLTETLIQCAEYDDVECWVENDVLNYCDPASLSRKIIPLQWGHDFDKFTGKHSPTFNKNIKVEVRTYNPKQRFSHTVRYSTDSDGDTTMSESSRETTSTQDFGSGNSTSTSSTTNETTGTTSSSTTTSVANPNSGLFNTGKTTIPKDTSSETYIIRKPNLTRKQANDLALKIQNQLSRNEFSANITLYPSRNQFEDISITASLQVNGLYYSRFNTSAKYPYYWPKRITTRFSMDGGLSMDIECVNHRLPATSNL